MKFFIPGKTFLVGEYAVLLGGAALGLATKPYFELTEAEYVNRGEDFHSDSPAGRYLKANKKENIFKFKDNYQLQGVRGGFGRSTAEYISAILPDVIQKRTSFFDILKNYKSLFSESEVKPSGIDLAFQYYGNVTLADPQINFFQTLDWNFADLDFMVISTGLKIPTHEHLAKLNLNDLKALPELSGTVSKVYAENKPSEFLYQMKNWVEMLDKHHLTHLNSVHLRMQLEKCEDIFLAKPCGALGADVMIVFFHPEKIEVVKKKIFDLGLTPQAHSYDLANGLSAQLRSLWSS